MMNAGFTWTLLKNLPSTEVVDNGNMEQILNEAILWGRATRKPRGWETFISEISLIRFTQFVYQNVNSKSTHWPIKHSVKNLLTEKVHPDKTLSNYILQLLQTLYLKPGFEVALADIQYPLSCKTFPEYTFWVFNLTEDVDVTTIIFPDAHYDSVLWACKSNQ